MNIFILDKDPRKAAHYHGDQHVVKMILESAQMLCTVKHLYEEHDVPYRATHQKHPCTQWVAQSLGNWHFLVALISELNKEYRRRYNKNINHKSYDAVKHLLPPKDIPEKKMTPFTQAMPDEHKNTDAITAYRTYYTFDKLPFLRYTKTNRPNWGVR